MWSMSDEELVGFAADELSTIGLLDPSVVERGYVVRVPKAYPVYDTGYQDNIATMRAWLEEHAPNVHPVGRNGMHRYNNQDHSMLTAMLAVENILDDARHDLWAVNVDEEYHEEERSTDDVERPGMGRPRRPDHGLRRGRRRREDVVAGREAVEGAVLDEVGTIGQQSQREAT